MPINTSELAGGRPATIAWVAYLLQSITGAADAPDVAVAAGDKPAAVSTNAQVAAIAGHRNSDFMRLPPSWNDLPTVAAADVRTPYVVRRMGGAAVRG
jgi:hypothetical protein